MKTVKGIYAEAKIFTDDVETYAEAQVKMICIPDEYKKNRRKTIYSNILSHNVEY